MQRNTTVRSKRTALAGLIAVLSVLTLGLMASPASAGSTVPGHSGPRVDTDNNGYPDEGVVVSGNYEEVYGDCVVRVNYRGTFDNTPYMDSGWMQNHYRCTDADGKTTTYNYLIVHESDPRYTGNPDWAVWGTWEYHVLTEGGTGNYVRPTSHVG